jgi:Cof subfamily protein (haloacid dehalogenase superfamily)
LRSGYSKSARLLKMKIKAICTDIDGTLLNRDRQLSKHTIETFRKVPKEIPIILASSRMPSAMRHLQQELDILQHPIICYNGGYVIEYGTDQTEIKVFDSVYIPEEIYSTLIPLTYGKTIHVSIFDEDHWFAPTNDQWTHREETITKVKAEIRPIENSMKELSSTKRGLHKIMLMGPESEIEELQHVLEEKFSNDIHIYRSKSTYLELAPRALSKASALAQILEQRFSIRMNEAIAFGDNYNDIELLQQVGLGVAVDNARDEVKAVANETTAKSYDDGVALAIEKHLL